MTEASGGWEEVLDAYEAHLGMFADAVGARDGDLVEVPVFEPPDGLGPVPPELTARARALVEETARLGSEHRVRMKTVLKEMQSHRRPQRRAEKRGSSFVDFSA